VPETRQLVKDYILREFLAGENPDELKPETPLISGGILDSIATVKLVSFLESSFAIKVEPHEIDVENLNTLDLIARMVDSKRKA